MKPQRAILGALGLFVLLVLALLVTGKRVLIHEVRVNPGEHYVVAEHGNLGDSKQASLVCRYFTGRSVRVSVFWYSANNILGKDQCPFISGEG